MQPIAHEGFQSRVLFFARAVTGVISRGIVQQRPANVNNLRIIESKPLLTAGDKSIEEIAELCGFSSLRTFDREFLNQVGVTPSKYQKQT